MSSPGPSEDGAFEDGDYEDNVQTPNKKRKSVGGRKLMRWDPDKDQLLLLTIESVCSSKNVSIPWESIAKQIEPYLSGEAIKQHLTKLYHTRVAHEFRVPGKVMPARRSKDGNELVVLPGKNAALLHFVPEKGRKLRKEIEDVEPEAKTPKKSKVKKEVKDAEFDDVTPQKSKVKKEVKDAELNDVTPQKSTTAGILKPATKATGGVRGRKRLTNEEDDKFENQSPVPQSTGKRGRNTGTQNANKKKEQNDEPELHDGSPSKKRKIISLPASLPKGRRDLPLRVKSKVNYNEQMEDEEEETSADLSQFGNVDAYGAAFESQKTAIVKSDPIEPSRLYHSQPSSVVNLPDFSVRQYQSFPPATESNFGPTSTYQPYHNAGLSKYDFLSGVQNFDASLPRSGLYVPTWDNSMPQLNTAPQITPQEDLTSSPIDMRNYGNFPAGLPFVNNAYGNNNMVVHPHTAPAAAHARDYNFESALNPVASIETPEHNTNLSFDGQTSPTAVDPSDYLSSYHQGGSQDIDQSFLTDTTNTSFEGVPDWTDDGLQMGSTQQSFGRGFEDTPFANGQNLFDYDPDQDIMGGNYTF